MSIDNDLTRTEPPPPPEGPPPPAKEWSIRLRDRSAVSLSLLIATAIRARGATGRMVDLATAAANAARDVDAAQERHRLAVEALSAALDAADAASAELARLGRR